MIVALCFLVLVFIIGLSIYQNPFENGIGCAIFAAGLPMWLAGRLWANGHTCQAIMGKLTMMS